nr:hypothetical protein [Tanacetum cinerariifolium]
MMLTFAKTHNMIAYLTKSDASKGFNQIIDFLNGSSIRYALSVNPNIYVSCIKQFWTSVAVKKVNDVMRLQALVDKKKVVITKATLRDALRLDDAEGIECLPNEEIFAELARMGYEKPSTKLTFYKAFFSSHWKFLIHTILQCMSAKRMSWNEFSSSMASAVICLSTEQVGDLFSHSTKYTSPALTQKVFANMRRVGKGFSGVDTLLFEGMLVVQEVGEGDADEVHVEDVNAAGVAAEGVISVADDVVPTTVDEPTIPSPTPPPQSLQDQPSTSQGGIIANIDADEDVVLEDAKDGRKAKIYKIDLEHAKKVLSMQEEELEPAEHQEVVDVVTTAKIITEVVTAVSDAITAASTTITAADVLIHVATLTAAPSRRRKGVVIRDPEETTTTSTIIHSEAKSKDKGKGILHKEDKDVKRCQALKRKPQTKVQARKNMMIYLRNVASFKMDYFKGMTYDDIRPIFKKHFDSNVAFLQKTKEHMDEDDRRALKMLNESQEDKAAKKQKLDEEVHVVDYEIYNEHNKTYFKIKRADGSHQLYLSFLSMLRNFDREDLEALWQFVKERFATAKPENFSDYFLLIILGAMFEKPDIQAQIWKNQRSVHGQAKVKSWRLLEFCEEESEVSLELLRFIRQQHQEGFQLE